MEILNTYIEYIAKGFEITGVLIIVAGSLAAIWQYLFSRQDKKKRSYKILRQELGKAILLGLEVLVAGDIIATVATEPTMNSVLVLGVIVLIRTFLSLSIEVEVEGSFPWQKQKDEKI